MGLALLVSCALLPTEGLAARPEIAPGGTPVVRVLRPDDVPGANDEFLPTGAIGRQELVTVLHLGTKLGGALARHGFVAGAVAAFSGPGLGRWVSAALSFRRPMGAKRTLSAVARALGESLEAGPFRVAPDRAFPHALLVVGQSSKVRTDTVVAAQGLFIYVLSRQDQRSHPPHLGRLHALLGRVMRKSS